MNAATQDSLQQSFDLRDSVIAERDVTNKDNGFKLIMSDRQLELLARTRVEMEAWIAALKRAAAAVPLPEMEGTSHSWLRVRCSLSTYCVVCREPIVRMTRWHGLICEGPLAWAARRCCAPLTRHPPMPVAQSAAVRYTSGVPSACRSSASGRRRCQYVRPSRMAYWCGVQRPCATRRTRRRPVHAQSGGTQDQPHQWVVGNVPAQAECLMCNKPCVKPSHDAAADMRCLWCEKTVHGACREGVLSKCTLGKHRSSILRPTAIRLVKDETTGESEWSVRWRRLCDARLVN